MVVYAFDVDETLEISKGPVKMVDLVKLREHGHIVGLCGNWAMVTLHCPPTEVHALATFLREHGAEAVTVADLGYVFARDNHLYAKLEAGLAS